MGGTGLEPVTPSLVETAQRARPFALGGKQPFELGAVPQRPVEGRVHLASPVSRGVWQLVAPVLDPLWTHRPLGRRRLLSWRGGTCRGCERRNRCSRKGSDGSWRHVLDRVGIRVLGFESRMRLYSLVSL